MALHISRDLLVLGGSTLQPNNSMYFTSLFLYGVMNFTIIGQTNFNLSGSSYLASSGTQGSINRGVGNEYAFLPEVGTYTVTNADINRILVLRSNANPRLNSGLFRVLSVVTASNLMVLDYRSAEFPPVESGSLQWKLFLSENAIPVPSDLNPRNPAGGYRGYGNSGNSRIIFESPFVSWQVRLTREPAGEGISVSAESPATGSVGPKFSIAPGYSGSSTGDWQQGFMGPHLHFAYHVDAGSTTTMGDSAAQFAGTVGIGPDFVSASPFRFYAWGEDQMSGSIFVYARRTTGALDDVASFGFVSDESILPLPFKNDPLFRLFTWGTHCAFSITSVGWGSSNNISNGTAESHQTLVAYGLNHRLVLGSPAPFVFVDQTAGTSGNPGFFNSPLHTAQAGDCPFIGATELLPVEAWAGTRPASNSYFSTAIQTAPLEPRRMGLMPIGLQGRANFGNHTTTSDSGKTWIHLKDGMYLPWSGSIIP